MFGPDSYCASQLLVQWILTQRMEELDWFVRLRTTIHPSSRRKWYGCSSTSNNWGYILLLILKQAVVIEPLKRRSSSKVEISPAFYSPYEMQVLATFAIRVTVSQRNILKPNSVTITANGAIVSKCNLSPRSLCECNVGRTLHLRPWVCDWTWQCLLATRPKDSATQTRHGLASGRGEGGGKGDSQHPTNTTCPNN